MGEYFRGETVDQETEDLPGDRSLQSPWVFSHGFCDGFPIIIINELDLDG